MRPTSMLDSLGNDVVVPVEEYVEKVMPFSFEHIPPEILVVIFSHLDSQTLNSVREVCHLWNRVALDDQIWLLLYVREFGSDHAGSLTRGTNWRLEYLTRWAAFEQWRRGKALHHTRTYNDVSISGMCVDFANEKLFCASMECGLIFVSDLRSNKDPGRYQCLDADYTAWDFGRNGAGFGRWNGNVVFRSFQPSGAVVNMQCESHDMVTAVCVAKGYLSGKPDTLGCLSGDSQGILWAWDTKTGKKLWQLKVCNSEIAEIKSDFDEVALLVNADNEAFVIDLSSREIRQLLYTATVSREYTTSIAAVDYGSRQCVLNAEKFVAVCSYDKRNSGETATYFAETTVFQVAIDESASKRRPQRAVAGSDCCNCALLEKSGKVVVIDLRNQTSGELTIKTEITPRKKDAEQFELGVSQPVVCSVAVNSLVCVLGFYNGYVTVHNVLTGEFLRVGSVLISRKRQQRAGVSSIRLDTDSLVSRGMFACGSCVQYFEFGHDKRLLKQERRAKKNYVRGGIADKRNVIHNKIQQEMEDFDVENWQREREEQILERYNGPDADIELELALALSDSLHLQQQQREQLEQLEQIEQIEQLEQQVPFEPTEGNSSQIDEDEELRLAMEISRREYEMMNSY